MNNLNHYFNCPVCNATGDFEIDGDDVRYEGRNCCKMVTTCQECKSEIMVQVNVYVQIKTDGERLTVVETTYIQDEDGDYHPPAAFDPLDIATWPDVRNKKQLALTL
jgi:C4-type Zn-finger protein